MRGWLRLYPSVEIADIVGIGLLMFVAHATDFIASLVFVIKMCLIMLAGAASLLIWISVIACGRLLACF